MSQINYNKIVELDTDEDCDELEVVPKGGVKPWQNNKMGRPSKAEDKFVKVNYHRYEVGKRQGVRQVCWQIQIMRTKDNKDQIMIYEEDIDQTGVEELMQQIWTFSRSDPTPNFAAVCALAKELAPEHVVQNGERGLHGPKTKKLLPPIPAMEAEAYLLGLKLGGLRRGLLQFRGYEVEGRQILAQGLIRQQDGFNHWLDWADGHPIVSHAVGEMTPSAGVFELFERFRKEVWADLGPGGAPSLDAV